MFVQNFNEACFLKSARWLLPIEILTCNYYTFYKENHFHQFHRAAHEHFFSEQKTCYSFHRHCIKKFILSALMHLLLVTVGVSENALKMYFTLTVAVVNVV